LRTTISAFSMVNWLGQHLDAFARSRRLEIPPAYPTSSRNMRRCKLKIITYEKARFCPSCPARFPLDQGPMGQGGPTSPNRPSCLTTLNALWGSLDSCPCRKGNKVCHLHLKNSLCKRVECSAEGRIDSGTIPNRIYITIYLFIYVSAYIYVYSNRLALRILIIVFFE